MAQAYQANAALGNFYVTIKSGADYTRISWLKSTIHR